MKDEFTSRLESLFRKHSGIIFSGFDSSGKHFAPQKVWTHVARIGSRPSAIFSDLCMEDAAKGWWELAQYAGMVSDRGFEVSCLISIGGLGSLPWAMVQFPLDTSILEVFALNDGYPEFIVASVSGDAYLAVVSEEDEIWIFLVKRYDSELMTVLLSP